jgi:hypothetical protein
MFLLCSHSETTTRQAAKGLGRDVENGEEGAFRVRQGGTRG